MGSGVRGELEVSIVGIANADLRAIAAKHYPRSSIHHVVCTGPGCLRIWRIDGMRVILAFAARSGDRLIDQDRIG